MSKFTEITHPKYRCSLGACPAVFKSEDGKFYQMQGRLVKQVEPIPDSDNQYEAIVEIPADLVLASLGMSKAKGGD